MMSFIYLCGDKCEVVVSVRVSIVTMIMMVVAQWISACIEDKCIVDGLHNVGVANS